METWSLHYAAARLYLAKAAGVDLPPAPPMAVPPRWTDAEMPLGLHDFPVAGVPPGTRALALFLVNGRAPADRTREDESCIFQVSLELRCPSGFVARPDHQGAGSDEWDDQVADLQFRNVYEYAVGHGVSVEVSDGQMKAK